jgi:multiple antibiotic resistance protein
LQCSARRPPPRSSYLVYRNGVRLLMRLCEVGTLVMMCMMAFVLLCIGIQILWTGWAELNHLAG